MRLKVRTILLIPSRFYLNKCYVSFCFVTNNDLTTFADCAQPETISDGGFQVPLQLSYAVNDVVTYTCNTATDNSYNFRPGTEVESRCMGDFTWSLSSASSSLPLCVRGE